MAVNRSKHRESNIPTWNEHFGNKAWPQSRTLFILNISVTFVVGSVCSHPDMLIIWDLITVNNHRLILHRSFCSDLLGTSPLSNKVCKSTAIRECTGAMLTTKTLILFFIYTTELESMNLTREATRAPSGVSGRIKMSFLYIYIYMCVCVCVCVCSCRRV